MRLSPLPSVLATNISGDIPTEKEQRTLFTEFWAVHMVGVSLLPMWSISVGGWPRACG